MPEIPSISDRVLTTFSFTGLLLGLLVNAIVTIRFDEYNPNVASLIRISFLIDTGFLVMSIVKGIIAYINITPDNSDIDPEKVLDSIYSWLARGLGAISSTIALIITNSLKFTLVFLLILCLLAFYEDQKIKRNQYCRPVQSTTEIENASELSVQQLQ